VSEPLDGLLSLLRCPLCRNVLTRRERAVCCPARHSFDLSRQGYLNLVVGHGSHRSADTPGMVAARARFLDSFAFEPILAAVADQAEFAAAAAGEPPTATMPTVAVPTATVPTATAAAPTRDGPGPVVLDVAAGTGHYLARVLDRLPNWRGLAVELSAPALRRAARVHPRAAAVGADAWQRLPLADDAVALALSIFGPRAPAELARVLRPGGGLVTVTPLPLHLRELAEPLGLLGIEADKQDRLRDRLGSIAELSDAREVVTAVELSRDQVHDVAAMGPSARHHGAAELAARVAVLPATTSVTVAVQVARYRTLG
jgi:23S rRNA (guanine745-N1)-methyltransferase